MLNYEEHVWKMYVCQTALHLSTLGFNYEIVQLGRCRHRWDNNIKIS